MFCFFDICDDRARRAASSRAASGCTTDAPRRAAPHGHVGVRVRATILASSVLATSIRLPRPWLSLTWRRTRRGGRRDRRAASGRAAWPCRHVTAPPPIGRLLLDFNTSSSSSRSASSASAATARGAADAPRRAGVTSTTCHVGLARLVCWLDFHRARVRRRRRRRRRRQRRRRRRRLYLLDAR